MKLKGFELSFGKTLMVQKGKQAMHGKVRLANAIGWEYFGSKYMFNVRIPWFRLWTNRMGEKSFYYKLMIKLGI